LVLDPAVLPSKLRRVRLDFEITCSWGREYPVSADFGVGGVRWKYLPIG
jgi:hypothetical protein